MANNLVVGDNASNTLAGTAGDDLIYGFDPNEPQGQVTSIAATRVANELNLPVYAGSPSGDADRLFIVEKNGLIKILDLNTGETRPTPFLDVSDQISPAGEGGLLGLAFDPDFANNGFFYVYLINTSGDTEVRRYHVYANNPDRADPLSSTLIISIDQPNGLSNHKGGWIDFGPDGFLYVALGDGGGGGDPQHAGQNVNTLLGKILRLDVHADAFPGDATRNYANPADNPFVGIAGRDEIFALGLRNPFRNGFDRSLGDLYIGDVGQGAWEEIDLGLKGANYGWNHSEGPDVFPGGDPLGPGIETDPIHAYDRSVGTTVIGGYVYRGDESEGLQGEYFFADFGAGTVSTLHHNGKSWTATDRTKQITADFGSIDNPSSFAEDGRGNLYVVDLDGEVFRLTPNQTSADTSDDLSGAGGDDIIFGGSGDDTIDGGDGNDVLYGGRSNDTIAGGADNDLVFGGNGKDSLGGDAGNDKIRGDNGDDTIDGGAGDDLLDGGAGNDKLTGGSGNDLFFYRGIGADEISDFTPGSGTDDRIAVTAVFSKFDDLLAAAAQPAADTIIDFGGGNTLTLLGVDKNDLDRDDFYFPTISGIFVSGTTADDTIGAGKTVGGQPFPTGDADVISGRSGNDTIDGLGGDDQIDGGGGNDSITGGTGADTLIGSDGTDTSSYLNDTTGVTVDLNSTGPQSGGDAQDDVLSQMESVIGGSGNDVLTGNLGVNQLDGRAGNDVLDGGRGGDVISGGPGDDLVQGGFGMDVLSGGGSNETLGDTLTYADAGAGVTVSLLIATQQITGGAGTDTISGFEHLVGSKFDDKLTGNAATNKLTGGDGNDTYVVDSKNDVVVELAGEGSADLVRSSASHQLGANFENLDLIGGIAIDGAGNDLDNVMTGNIAANKLEGGDGNDVLNGGLGTDTLIGGDGNDTYVVDVTADVVTELAGEGSADLVMASANYTIGAEIENLTLIAASIKGTGNELDNTVNGNNTANVLDGADGNDTLNGGFGNDTLIGGKGADALTGGDGIDTASYADDAAGVTVNLNLVGVQSGGDATDDVLLQIENVIGGSGNDILTGDLGVNWLEGGAGDDVLDGGRAGDTLLGRGGDDIIQGGLGRDVLRGGTGGETLGDTLTYADAGAGVTVSLLITAEQITGGAGPDTISGFEHLTGSKFDDRLIGNAGANKIVGGSGNDVIIGDAGADTLTGGGGDDAFRYRTPTEGSDTILDFNSATEADKISIIKSGFMIPARIAVGAAVAADDFDLHYFVDGPAAAGNAPAATEAHGQFLFNTTSNELFWDSNGTAAGGTTLIATLNTALQATDFELR